jgi:cell division protein FtsB
MSELDYLKDEVMTLEIDGGLWVTAEDYAEAHAHIKHLEAALDECEHAAATVARLEAENARLKAAILALSKGASMCAPRAQEGQG